MSFSSLPPKEAMVALVVTDMIRFVQKSRRHLVKLLRMTFLEEMRTWFRSVPQVRESKPFPTVGMEPSSPARCLQSRE